MMLETFILCVRVNVTVEVDDWYGLEASALVGVVLPVATRRSGTTTSAIMAVVASG